MHFAIYSRKSVYTGKGESVENQIEMCKQYIYSKFESISDMDFTIYEDEGFSAKNTERPQFQKMRRDLRQRSFDYIVCYRLDRISRNVSDFAALIEDLNEKNISFLCIREEFDTSKPMGKAMMYIASVFAQLERETIAERVRDNMLLLARTGRWLGGTTPTGYGSEKVQEIILDGKIKTACKLTINPLEIEAIKIMGAKLLELHSISGVSKYLIKREIKSRNDNYYSLIGIKEILSNPVYCIADKEARDYYLSQNSDVCFEEQECSHCYGLLSYNKRNHSKKHAPRQPKDQWIIAIGKHPGIFTGRQWTSIQNILDAKKANSHQLKAHNDYALLSGLILCKKCGSRMFAKSHRDRNKNGQFYYICQNKLRGGSSLCNCINLNGPSTDSLVYQHLLPYIKESINPKELIIKLKQRRRVLLETEKNPFIINTEAQIKKYKEEMDALVGVLTQPGISSIFIQKINTKIEELNEKLESLQREQMSSNDTIIAHSNSSYHSDQLYCLIYNLDHLLFEEKRVFIKQFIPAIEWDEICLKIYITKDLF